MAFAPSTTPARVNPTWVPPAHPYPPLERFFRRRGGASSFNRAVPVRPAPETEVA